MPIPLVLAALLACQAPPAEKAEPELYPAERPRAHVLFFMLEGELKAEPLRKALADLSTKDAECKLVYGPRKTQARPGAQFAAVEAPAALGVKEIGAALRKGCSAADPVACTVFQGSGEGTGSSSEGQGFLGMGSRDFVLGMSGDIRWYDALAGWRQFYFGAGKIGAKEIVSDERMGKVSIVGTGIQSAPGYAARMFRTLSAAGINIEIISTSEIRITCIIPEDSVTDAVRALHAAFELEKVEL